MRVVAPQAQVNTVPGRAWRAVVVMVRPHPGRWQGSFSGSSMVNLLATTTART
jgi:hypothetical protein